MFLLFIFPSHPPTSAQGDGNHTRSINLGDFVHLLTSFPIPHTCVQAIRAGLPHYSYPKMYCINQLMEQCKKLEIAANIEHKIAKF